MSTYDVLTVFLAGGLFGSLLMYLLLCLVDAIYEDED